MTNFLPGIYLELHLEKIKYVVKPFISRENYVFLMLMKMTMFFIKNFDE